MSATERQERLDDGSVPVDDTSLGGRPATTPLYSFSSGYAGWWSTIWRLRRFSDGQVLVSGRTFGRRHEQRAWEQMQKAAKERGYV